MSWKSDPIECVINYCNATVIEVTTNCLLAVSLFFRFGVPAEHPSNYHKREIYEAIIISYLFIIVVYTSAAPSESPLFNSSKLVGLFNAGLLLLLIFCLN